MAVIAIIAVLLALTLPTIQRLRENARRLDCGNNLRQMTLAMQQYHDGRGSFPMGNRWQSETGVRYPKWSDDNSWGWPAFLLPFLDEQRLYDKFDFAASPWTSEMGDPYFRMFGPSLTATNKEACQQMPQVFACPSVVPKGAQHEFKDYAINGGGFRIEVKENRETEVHYCCPERGTLSSGVAFLNSSLRLSQIEDGLSDTYMFLEARHWALAPATFPIHDVPINPFVWVNQQSPGYVTGIAPPNAPIPSAEFSGRVAQSYHPGGVMVSYCDGRVDFLSDKIDYDLYLATLNRNDGGIVSGF